MSEEVAFEVLVGFGAFFWVLCALVGIGELLTLVGEVLEEMCAAFGFESVVLYLFDVDGQFVLRCYVVGVLVCDELFFDEEVWCLVVVGGAPIVLCDFVSWFVENLFELFVRDWFILLLVFGDVMVGVVIVCAVVLIVIDLLLGIVLSLFGY